MSSGDIIVAVMSMAAPALVAVMTWNDARPQNDSEMLAAALSVQEKN